MTFYPRLISTCGCTPQAPCADAAEMFANGCDALLERHLRQSLRPRRGEPIGMAELRARFGRQPLKESERRPFQIVGKRSA